MAQLKLPRLPADGGASLPPEWGWKNDAARRSAVVLLGRREFLKAAAILFAAFLAWERRTAAPMLTQKVEAMARANASWIDWTMFGMNGATIDRNASGTAALKLMCGKSLFAPAHPTFPWCAFITKSAGGSRRQASH